jgi:hypothetical protein
MPPKISNQVQLLGSFQKKVVTGLFAKESSHWILLKASSTGFHSTKNLQPSAIIGVISQKSSHWILCVR